MLVGVRTPPLQAHLCTSTAVPLRLPCIAAPQTSVPWFGARQAQVAATSRPSRRPTAACSAASPSAVAAGRDQLLGRRRQLGSSRGPAGSHCPTAACKQGQSTGADRTQRQWALGYSWHASQSGAATSDSCKGIHRLRHQTLTLGRPQAAGSGGAGPPPSAAEVTAAASARRPTL